MTISPSGRTTTSTPSPWTATYSHPSGVNLILSQIRLLKLNEAGEYSEDQISAPVVTSVVPGATITITWASLGFKPLDWNTNYAMEWSLTDADLVSSGWIGRSYFNTNKTPEQGSIAFPQNATAFLGTPLILFDLSDADDVGGAWFEYQDDLIWELQNLGTGSGAGNTNLPLQVAYGPSGKLYVADYYNDRLVVYDTSLTQIATVTGLTSIRAVAVDPSENIYVGWGSGSYAKYNSSLVQQWTFTASGSGLLWGGASTDGITLFLTEVQGRVYGFNCSSGSPYLILGWGGGGQEEGRFSNPTGIASYATLTTYDLLGLPVTTPVAYIVDRGNYRVQVFNASTLEFLFQFGQYGILDGQFLLAAHVVVDPLTGNVWVTDDGRHDIQVFTPYGEFIEVHRRFGAGNDQWKQPYAIDFDWNGAGIAIGDNFTNRVKRFAIPSFNGLGAASHLAGEIEISGTYAGFNGDFTSDISQWTANNETGWTASYAWTPSGRTGGGVSASISVVPTNTTTASRFVQSGSAIPYLLPVVPGNSYQANGWFYRDNASIEGSLNIRWLYADGTLLIDDIPGEHVGFDGIWQEAKVARVAPPQAAYAQIMTRITRSPDLAGILLSSAEGRWDDITFDPASRFIRPGTFVAGTRFTYQSVSDDFSNIGSYTLRARGKDINSIGPWSAPILITKPVTIAASVISPTPGQIINTASPLIVWNITSGSQWRYKVQAVVAATGEIAYDSDWIQNTSTRSHLIPPGYLVDGGSYIAQVWIDDGSLEVLI